MKPGYENFTDRARRVMQFSNQEAQRFNHDYIGTEHILLGLIKEGSGTGVAAMKCLGVDPRKIRLEIEKLLQSGADLVTTGKLPQTPRAKKVIEFAIYEATVLQHSYVGTEHILLGLLREGEGIAFQVLDELGLRVEKVRGAVLGILEAKLDPPETPVQEPQEPPMKAKIFEIGPGDIGINALNDFLANTKKENILFVAQSSSGDSTYITIIYSL